MLWLGPPLHALGQPRNYLAPKIASLAALATRNLTTLLAAIWMVSPVAGLRPTRALRSEEHTSELQSHLNLVCRLLLEKKKKYIRKNVSGTNVRSVMSRL